MEIKEVRDSLELHITSGNNVPVSRATVNALELRALLDYHARLQGIVDSTTAAPTIPQALIDLADYFANYMTLNEWAQDEDKDRANEILALAIDAIDGRAPIAAPGIEPDVLEKAAIELWHRWGNDSVLEWEDESHKAEYRLAAESVLALIGASSKAASTPAPGIDLEQFRERIKAAIVRITTGQAPMRVPADQADPDIVLADILSLIDASPKGGSDALTIPEPHLECYSNNDGDSWYEHPADYELVQGLKVGDTYTLDVSHYSVERTYRVTKAPDETSDDYEVEPVQATSAHAQAGDAEVQP